MVAAAELSLLSTGVVLAHLSPQGTGIRNRTHLWGGGASLFPKPNLIDRRFDLSCPVQT